MCVRSYGLLVRVYKFAMADSIEERMYTLQEAKTALGNGSLRKLTADEKKKARITALKGMRNSFVAGLVKLFNILHTHNAFRPSHNRT